MKLISVDVAEIYLDHIKFSLEMIQQSTNQEMPANEDIEKLINYVTSKIGHLNHGAIDINEIFKKGLG